MTAAAPAGDFADYSIRNYRPFASPDGGGFNVTLYRGGTRIAQVHNGGYGGCHDWHWLIPAEHAPLAAHVATLPEVHSDVGGTPFSCRLDIDGFVDELITVEEQRKAIARLKKSTGS